MLSGLDSRAISKTEAEIKRIPGIPSAQFCARFCGACLGLGLPFANKCILMQLSLKCFSFFAPSPLFRGLSVPLPLHIFVSYIFSNCAPDGGVGGVREREGGQKERKHEGVAYLPLLSFSLLLYIAGVLLLLLRGVAKDRSSA